MPVNILADVKDNTGLILTTATVPAVTAFEVNFYGLKVAGGQTHVGLINWVVPDDYDASADELRIRLACNRSASTAGDAAKTINTIIYRKRPIPSIVPDDAQGVMPAGLALSADLGIVTTGPVVPALGTNLLNTWVEIVADAKIPTTTVDASLRGTTNRTLSATADASIKPGDILMIRMTLSATMTDDVNIYGANIWYRSNLAFSEINSR
jgi:hypothetical protein